MALSALSALSQERGTAHRKSKSHSTEFLPLTVSTKPGNCLIQWGEVQEKTAKGISIKGISIKGIELISESSELKLKEKEKTVQNPFSIQLQPSSLITVHWGNAIEKISSERLKNLKEYTFRSLKAIGNNVSSDVDE